jgi:predicted Zn finger-like uncharacterized protein
MTVQKIAGYLASGILFFFAVIYALASSVDPSRIVVSVVLFSAGFGILYFVRRRQPTKLVQKIEVPGRVKAQDIKCPNCSAPIEMGHIKVVQNVPLAKCTYCGHVFKLVEEPKW